MESKQLSPQQMAALQAIEDFIGDPTRRQFNLFGPAGTGKTYLISELSQRHDNLRLCAFTGKAASVLAKKTGCAATTVHGLQYKLVEIGRDRDGKKVLQFERVTRALHGDIIIVDESSMISQEIGRDIMLHGAKVIFVGDPHQLPPVKGGRYCLTSDFELTEVHRQALESGIIRQATNMREHSFYEDDAECQVVHKIKDADLLAADMVLCHRNVTRHRLNRRMRTLLDRPEGHLVKGEPVMALKNCARAGIFNGAVYELAEDFHPNESDEIVLAMGDDAVLKLHGVGFVEPGGSVDDFDEDRNLTTVFDHGYAGTVHKSQGSEYDRVVLIDEYRRPEGRREWAYTGISRAAKHILIQR